jgi:hypothetical protein
MAVGTPTLKVLQTSLYSIAFGCSAVILGTAILVADDVLLTEQPSTRIFSQFKRSKA